MTLRVGTRMRQDFMSLKVKNLRPFNTFRDQLSVYLANVSKLEDS